MSLLPLFGAEEAPAEDVPEQEPAAAAEPPRAPGPAPVGTAPIASTQSLYRKYRPQSFDADDLVGQDHVVRTLRNAIRLDRLAHAYLFCGPRGTGKTTTARLIAKAVNCLDPDPDARPCNRCESCLAIASGATTDVIEIDAASNRGIDDIRDLRERVKYAPSQLRYKFYIIDEAHQITGAAANAFLKTLEEPPPHTKFVLATTDPEELLPTIVSRCQRFDFRRIGSDAMASRLRTVADEERISITDEALAEIARHATGSLRDALGLLDQLALHESGNEGAAIDADAVRAMLGISRNDRVRVLLEALADRDLAAALDALNTAVESGEDARQLNRQVVAALRAILQDRAAGRPTPGDLGAVARRLELPALTTLLRTFSEVDYQIRHSPYAHLPLELAFVESIVGTGAPVAPPASAVAPQASQSAPARHDREPIDPGRPTSRLRDRVRGTASPEPPPPAPVSDVAERAPAPIRPPEPEPEPDPAFAPPPAPPRPSTAAAPTAAEGSPAAGAGGITVDMVAELWPRIRSEVKASNRRAEALLSSADPARVSGSRITIVTPYPFHRDKMNSDDVRELVQSAMSRALGTTVTVEAACPEDLGGAAPRPASPRPVAIQHEAEAAPGRESPAEPDDGPDPLTAAANIFDAVIVDDPSGTSDD